MYDGDPVGCLVGCEVGLGLGLIVVSGVGRLVRVGTLVGCLDGRRDG